MWVASFIYDDFLNLIGAIFRLDPELLKSPRGDALGVKVVSSPAPPLLASDSKFLF